MPPEPTVTVGEPLNTMSPPVVVPAAVNAPALSFRAGADVLDEMLVVAMFCETVRLPVLVVTDTVPVDEMPLWVAPPVPATVTCPIVSARPFRTLNEPIDDPDAMVDKALDALLSV